MFGRTKFPVKDSGNYRYIKKEGSDGNVQLVLLHGMFGGLSNFDGLLERLQAYPVLVPEIPLYEFSKSELTIPELACWVNRLLDSHQIEHPVLLGNSMGGHIALEHALSFPEDTRALVLTGSSGLFENEFGSSRPRRYDREYIKERASMTFYEDLVNDTIIDEILDVLQSPEKLGRLLRIARSTHAYNMEDELKRISVPVQLIWGQNDQITPAEVARTFHEKLPDSRLDWIERCGHAPMMERPREFTGYLKDFLSDIESTSKSNKDQTYEKDYSHP